MIAAHRGAGILAAGSAADVSVTGSPEHGSRVCHRARFMQLSVLSSHDASSGPPSSENHSQSAFREQVGNLEMLPPTQAFATFV